MKNNRLIYALAAVIAILVVTTGIALQAYREQTTIAEANLELANRKTTEAEANAKEALRQAAIADEMRKSAMATQSIAEIAQNEMDRLRLQLKQSQRTARNAEEQARINSALASQSQRVAEEQAQRARKAENSAIRGRYIAQAKAMAIKSRELGSDPEQQALVALQAYKFNTNSQGNPFDNDIYTGLYNAHQQFKDPLVVGLAGHSKGTVRALVTNKKTGEMFSGGSDGRVLRWSSADGVWKADSIAGHRKEFQVNSIDISPDGTGSLQVVAQPVTRKKDLSRSMT